MYFLYKHFIPVIFITETELRPNSWTVEVTEKSQEVYNYVYYISRGTYYTP